MTHTTTLQVLVNQTALSLPQGAVLADAVMAMQAKPPFAAAVNLQFVAKTKYHQTKLNDGDRIDLIAPVVGG
jgi:sulfur carrier protein